ncbi:MAG: trypsin-like peptidase domain-containing protein [Pseudomonadota bacterium]
MLRTASHYLQLIGKTDSGLESRGGSEGLTASSSRDSLERLVERVSDTTSSYSLGEETRVRLLADAKDALARLRNDGPAAAIGEDHRIGLEAIVVTDGRRPCPRIRDHRVVDDGSLGGWRAQLNAYKTDIESVSESVGRIDDAAGVHQGTGFVVGEHLIMTNRHVLETIGSREASGNWEIAPGATIDFLRESGNSERAIFDIESVHFAGPDDINGGFNLAWLDMAVLRCKPSTSGEFPKTLEYSTDAGESASQRDIYVIGYPAQPGVGHRYARAVLDALFDGEYSIKRWAPGRITQARGQVAGDTNLWAITHDATTLGGNSGSCVVELGPMGLKVIGLHYAGQAEWNNYAHVAAELADYFR